MVKIRKDFNLRYLPCETRHGESFDFDFRHKGILLAFDLKHPSGQWKALPMRHTSPCISLVCFSI